MSNRLLTTPKVCVQYVIGTAPDSIDRGRMLIYCIQSKGLVNYFIACFSKDTINMFSTLKNFMNVCPGPQKLYNSEHNYEHEPYKEGLYHVYSTLNTLATG